MGKTKPQLYDEVEYVLKKRGMYSGFLEINVTIDYLAVYLNTLQPMHPLCRELILKDDSLKKEIEVLKEDPLLCDMR